MAYIRHTYRQGHTHLLNGVLELIAHAKVKHARFALTVFIGFRVSARFALTVFIHVCVYVSICMHTQTAHNHPQNTHTHTHTHKHTLSPSPPLSLSVSIARVFPVCVSHARFLSGRAQAQRKHAAQAQHTHAATSAAAREKAREGGRERGLGFRV